MILGTVDLTAAAQRYLTFDFTLVMHNARVRRFLPPPDKLRVAQMVVRRPFHKLKLADKLPT